MQLKQKQITLTSIRWTLHIFIRCCRKPEFFSVFACGPYLHCFLRSSIVSSLFPVYFSPLTYFCLLHLPLLLNQLTWSRCTPVRAALQRGSLFVVIPRCLRPLSGCARRTAPAPQLLPSRPSQHSVLETRSVGGRQLHARHTLGRVLLAFLPFKPL